jgi:peptidoglycan/LPS O-acetylase OafA/YrhL
MAGTPVASYRAEVDGLRAVAVLAVVAFHAFPSAAPGGFAGVDVFFVISGFLISTIILQGLRAGTFGFVEFYGRRIRRIFPALFLVLAACLAFGWFALLADEYRQLGKHVAAGAGFVSNLALWGESGYFDNEADAKPLLHLWSLGIEEQFYLAWPLLLWVAWRRGFNLFAVIGGLALASFALNVGMVGRDPVGTFYSPQTRFWELLVGALLAHATLTQRHVPRAAGANAMAAIGAALIAAALYGIDRGKAFPGWWALLPTVGTALLIHAGSGAWLNRVVLSSRAVVGVGLISYPLYLWHWPLLSFAGIVHGGTPPTGVRLALVAAAVLLAWATYRLVERPIRFGRRGAAAKAGALLVLMVVAGLAGYATWERKGFPSRSNANLAMDEDEIVRERQRYWNGPVEINFESGRPRIVIFGDSQAWDVFSALRHDPKLGLRLIRSDYRCTAFGAARKGDENVAQACRSYFAALLQSPELRQADVLIHANAYYAATPVEDYQPPARELLAVNPRLRIVFFGSKPMLGNSWISINAITRNHRSLIGMNDYLTTLMVNPDEGNRYSKAVAEALGAVHVDVQGVFCSGGCPFHVENRFAYFDQNHWTEHGARIFHQKLAQTPFYAELVGERAR